MAYIHLLGFAWLLGWPLAASQAQQPTPFGAGAGITKGPDTSEGKGMPDIHRAAQSAFRGVDSVVYHLDRSSRLEVKTGKAGLFGFAGHSHVIRARSFSGEVVYYPKTPASSHLQITVQTDSLEVLTPPDTAEIRKVTAAMRADVLHTDQYHEIRLVSKEVVPTAHGFHLVGALTLVGQTRDVPVDLVVKPGADTLRAEGTFSIKQTEFGIKPYSGGPAGTVKVADRVMFSIDAVAVRAGPRAAGAEQ
jgi:polyisoprenoid-binding protein YceI